MIKEFYFPEKISEAVSILKKCRGKAVVIAGGTRVARSLPSDAEYAVDCRALPLKYIKRDSKWLRIGAAAEFSRLEKSPVLKKWAGGIIASAAARGSSCLMRNMATTAGNLARPYPFNNLPPVFLALDAHAVISGGGKVKTLPLAGLYDKAVASELGRKSLLIEIKIPAQTRLWAGVYEKLSKAETDWESYVNAAVVLSIKGGVCRHARIALGSVLPRALRFEEAEKILEGKAVAKETADSAAEAVFKKLGTLLKNTPLNEYRRRAAKAVVRRCIITAAGEATEATEKNKKRKTEAAEKKQ